MTRELSESLRMDGAAAAIGSFILSCELYLHRLDLVRVRRHRYNLASYIEDERAFNALHQIRRAGRSCLLGQRHMDVAFLASPLVEAHDQRIVIRGFLDSRDDNVVLLRAKE